MTEREVSSERVSEERLREMLQQLVDIKPGLVRMAPGDVPELIAGLSELLALRSSVKTMGVKKLEWKRVGWVEALAAPEGLGVWYSINALDPKERTAPFTLKIFVGTFRKTSTSEMWVDGGTFPTIEEAKAAAQADYERRIPSAIEAHSEGEAVAIPEEVTARYWNMMHPDIAAICEPNPGTATHHLKWMLQELRTRTDFGKAMRWLGFVQGVMIVGGYTTVQAERDFTRPYLSAPTAALKGDRP